jgi:hypothetical protein
MGPVSRTVGLTSQHSQATMGSKADHLVSGTIGGGRIRTRLVLDICRWVVLYSRFVVYCEDNGTGRTASAASSPAVLTA